MANFFASTNEYHNDPLGQIHGQNLKDLALWPKKIPTTKKVFKGIKSI